MEEGKDKSCPDFSKEEEESRPDVSKEETGKISPDYYKEETEEISPIVFKEETENSSPVLCKEPCLFRDVMSGLSTGAACIGRIIERKELPSIRVPFSTPGTTSHNDKGSDKGQGSKCSDLSRLKAVADKRDTKEEKTRRIEVTSCPAQKGAPCVLVQPGGLPGHKEDKAKKK